MASTLVRKVMLRIAADDGDTETKLDKISAKADDLARKHPDLTVKINTAAAAAKLAVLRQELKKTNDEAAKDGGSSGGIKSFSGALGNLFNTVALGGVGGGWAEMSMFGKVMAGVNLATGLGEPLVAALTVGVMGLTSGVVAAGAGLGVFGLVAKSTLTAAATAAGQVQTAQIAYNSAIATGTKHSVAYAAEQKAILTAYAQLSPAQIQLSENIGNAQNSWQTFVQSNTAGVSKIMSQGIGLLPKVFQAMQPFLAPTEGALGNIVSLVGQGLGSSGFKKWISDFAAASGPDLTKIAVAIGHIITGLGGVLHAFLPMSGSMLSGLDKITGKFSTWGQTLTGHNGFKSLMSMFQQDTPMVTGILGNLAGILKTVVGQMTSMSTISNSKSLLQLAGPVLQFANALLKAHPGLVELVLYMKLAADGGGKLATGVKTGVGAFEGIKTAKKNMDNLTAGFGSAKLATDEATGAWGTFGGKLSTAMQKLGLLKVTQGEATVATEGETGAQAELNTTMSLNPIGLIIIAIAALVIAFAELWKHSAAFRDFWKTAWKDIKTVAVDTWHGIDGVFHDVEKIVAIAWNTVKKDTDKVWGWIKTFIHNEITNFKHEISWFESLPGKFRSWFDQARHAIATKLDQIVGDAERLPGRIMGAIASLPGKMLTAGQHIIQMLANGITSAIGDVTGAIGNIGSEILSHLPFSPAKKGPLSGAGSPDLRGAKISRMIADGMTSGEGYVAAAATRVARATQMGTAAHSAYAGAGYGQPQKVQLEFVGNANDPLWVLFKRNIRVKGGDPTVLGR